MTLHIFSLLVLATIVCNVHSASVGGQEVDKEKIKEAAMVLINDCKTKVGASDDDLMVLKSKKLPETPEGLCLVECIFNTAKIMKQGKLSKEGAIDAFEPAMKGDQVKVDKMKKMIDLCAKEIDDGDADSCKTAKMIVECTSKHGAEFGFKFPTV